MKLGQVHENGGFGAVSHCVLAVDVGLGLYVGVGVAVRVCLVLFDGNRSAGYSEPDYGMTRRATANTPLQNRPGI